MFVCESERERERERERVIITHKLLQSFHSPSPIRIEPAGIKDLRVIPVFWIMVVGIETHHYSCSFGNGVAGQLEVVCRGFPAATNSRRIHTQYFLKYLNDHTAKL